MANVFACSECRGSNLTFDCMLEWSTSEGQWRVCDVATFKAWCGDCQDDKELVSCGLGQFGANGLGELSFGLVCETCRQDDLMAECQVEWNPEDEAWENYEAPENFFCRDCQAETQVVEV